MADGKVGTAYIQELRFNEYCKRLQNLITPTLDLEFKIWMESNGVNIDSSLFELRFNQPQNFAAYRQSELDTARASVYSTVAEIPHLSKRFALKRFLGLSEEEIKENEALWKEENGNKLKPVGDAAAEMRGLGITPSTIGAEADTQDADAPDDLAAQVPAEGAETEQPPAAPPAG
jgi:hypothetical protein